PCPRPGEGDHQGALVDVTVQQERVQGGVHQSRVGAVEGTVGKGGVEQLHLGQELSRPEPHALQSLEGRAVVMTTSGQMGVVGSPDHLFGVGRGPLGAHLIDTTWVRGFGGVCGALCQGSGSMSGPWRVRGGVLGPGMDVYLTSSLVVAYTHGDLEGGTSTVRQDQRRLPEQIGAGGGTDTIGRVRDHVHQCCTRDHDPAEEAVIAYPGMVVRTDATGEYGVSVGK